MFIIEVKGLDGKWHALRPSGEKPYRFGTREEADRTVWMCYPDQVRVKCPSDRVVRVRKGPQGL